MKKTFAVVAIAAMFAACSSKNDTTTDATNSVIQIDFLNQSLLNDKGAEMNMSGVSDTIVGSDGVQYVKMRANTPGATTANRNTAAPKHKTAGTSTRSTPSNSTGAGTSTTTTANTPVVAKKKGWSNSAKGAVIGAGTGAAAGAIIGKNKVKSAIIGGAIGAGGGFVIGKIIDKKAEKQQ